MMHYNISSDITYICMHVVYAANQTRKFSSPFDTEVQMPKVTDDEYVMLKDATCMQDISKSMLMQRRVL